MASSILNSDDGVISGTSGLKSTGGDDGNLVFQSKGTETARINTDKQIVAAAGTASLPVITTTGDTNTGIFFPAADTIAFAEGGVERMRITSDGDVLIGATTSLNSVASSKALVIESTLRPEVNLFRNNTNVVATSKFGQLNFWGNDTTSNTPIVHAFIEAVASLTHSAGDNPTDLVFGTTLDGSATAAEVVRFTQAGNVGIGTSSPVTDSITFVRGSGKNAILELVGNGNTANTSGFSLLQGTDNAAYVYNRANASLIFGTNNTERARITSGGDLLLGTTSASGKLTVAQTAGDTFSATFQNAQSSGSAGYGVRSQFTNWTPNSTGAFFFYGSDPSAVRFEVRSNGGIANYSANDVNLSDRREKTNFAPAKNYLDTICSIPVQTFNYIDQNHEEDPGLTLGVVAQDVQEVAPELVMESNWGTQEEPKMRLSIYQTDLQYALMKCIQELKAELDTVKAELATLKGN